MDNFNPLESTISKGILIKLQEFTEEATITEESPIYVPALQEGLSDGGREVTDVDEFYARWSTVGEVIQVSQLSVSLAEKQGVTPPKIGDMVYISRRSIQPANYFFEKVAPVQNFTGYLIVDQHNILSINRK